jgi:hypothetical protein
MCMLQYDLSVAKRKTYMFEQTNTKLKIRIKFIYSQSSSIVRPCPSP